MSDRSPASSADTSTLYMGLRLRHPFVAGASPLSAHQDSVRRLEDGGAAAIVLHSLFEEQITEAQSGRIHGLDVGDAPRGGVRRTPFPPPDEYPFAPDEHLEHVRRVKAAVAVPVIASINGTTAQSWLRYARLLQDAGADAIEVNFYEVVTDLLTPAVAVETEILHAVMELKRDVQVPIAVKLSPFFTAFGNMAHRLDQAGADGLVLFNRFYQPDIDTRARKAVPTLELSRSAELLLRLRWLAILHGRVRPSLAATGGIETWNDGVKAILAGAHAVHMVSAVLRHGPPFFATMVEKLVAWMEWAHVTSVDAMRGQVSLQHAHNPGDFERANYVRALHQWGT
jgi:dihydroorotate dehydrogenase (fumarate)